MAKQSAKYASENIVTCPVYVLCVLAAINTERCVVYITPSRAFYCSFCVRRHKINTK